MARKRTFSLVRPIWLRIFSNHSCLLGLHRFRETLQYTVVVSQAYFRLNDLADESSAGMRRR